MIHLIYIYLIINSFIAGNYLFNDDYDDKGFKRFLNFSVLFLFGAPWILLYLISELPIFRWITFEIRFLYTFYFTNYWKNAVENNEERDKEGVLEMLNNFAEKSNKQSKRHNRLIQKRYRSN
jgi:hypothetical protein